MDCRFLFLTVFKKRRFVVWHVCMFVRDYLVIGETDFDAVFRKLFCTFMNRLLQLLVIITQLVIY